MISATPLIPLHPCRPSISVIPTVQEAVDSGLWQRLTLIKLPDFAYPSGRTVLTVHLCVPSTLSTLLKRVVDSPNYISCFTNLRHLTFANLDPARDEIGEEFTWVNGAIAVIQSPITHLAFEIRARKAADINVVDWKAIDALISTRTILQSLVQVLVVFKRVAHPVAIRRLVLLTTMMGLFATRRPKMYP